MTINIMSETAHYILLQTNTKRQHYTKSNKERVVKTQVRSHTFTARAGDAAIQIIPECSLVNTTLISHGTAHMTVTLPHRHRAGEAEQLPQL